MVTRKQQVFERGMTKRLIPRDVPAIRGRNRGNTAKSEEKKGRASWGSNSAWSRRSYSRVSFNRNIQVTDNSATK